MASPCQWNPALKFREKILPCSEDYACKKGIKEYAIANWKTTSLEVLGVAWDGHAIYGPYDDAGNLWQPCDVDVCNGRFFGNIYAYVATSFHPYFVGCWGPANMPNIA